MMNMQSRTQYLKELRREYLRIKQKKERGRLLDEAEKRTGLERKYLVKKLRAKSNLDRTPEQRKKRKVVYDKQVVVALAVCWRVFDHPFTVSMRQEGVTLSLGEFSRSRPYKKNDNCLVEQKNKTHVRKLLGHLRYDTAGEQKILRNLYRSELRLYKNFFQSVMKLVSKERIAGKIHKKYDRAKTPYHRVMESKTETGYGVIFHPSTDPRFGVIDKSVDTLKRPTLGKRFMCVHGR